MKPQIISAILFFQLTIAVLGTVFYVYFRKAQRKLVPKDKYDEAWNEVFRNITKNPTSRNFQNIQKIFRVLTGFLIIPITLAMLVPSLSVVWVLIFALPFFAVTSLAWIVLSVFQFLIEYSRIPKWIQAALLVLVLLPIPVLSNNLINGFKVQYGAYIKNKTSQILYFTAITTDHSSPKVISKRDIPIQPQSSVDLGYDEEYDLAGFAVCRTEDDCRLLPPNSDSSFYEINSYESLERLNPSWLAAIRSTQMDNNNNLIIMALSLIPILLLSGWLYLE